MIQIGTVPERHRGTERHTETQKQIETHGVTERGEFFYVPPADQTLDSPMITELVEAPTFW